MARIIPEPEREPEPKTGTRRPGRGAAKKKWAEAA
jgi:hypothetical protein